MRFYTQVRKAGTDIQLYRRVFEREQTYEWVHIDFSSARSSTPRPQIFREICGMLSLDVVSLTGQKKNILVERSEGTDIVR